MSLFSVGLFGVVPDIPEEWPFSVFQYLLLVKSLFGVAVSEGLEEGGETTVFSAPFDAASLVHVVMQFSENAFIWSLFHPSAPAFVTLCAHE